MSKTELSNCGKHIMIKKMVSLLRLCLVLPLMSFSSGKTLVVGTNAEFPPFTYIDKGEIVGFDIDVIKEVSKRLNVEIKIKDMPFDALIPELMLGKLNALAAGITYTAERAKRALFATPHLTNDPLVVLSYKKPFKEGFSLKELEGQKVVVNEGFTADIFLSSALKTKPMRLGVIADAFMALTSGQADYFVTAKSTFASYVKKQNPQDFYCHTIADQPETYALVISKHNEDLYAEIQKIIEEMKKDGTLEKIQIKWGLNA